MRMGKSFMSFRACVVALVMVRASLAVNARTPTHTKAPIAVADPIGSVQGLISRVLGPQYVKVFQLEVIPADPSTGNDVFELDTNTGSPVIRGNKGLAIAAGLGWYLKYYCNSSWGWGRNGTGMLMQVPSPAPAPTPIRVVSPAKYRYAWNVCTFGYSYAFYSMAQWQEELDRMALWGVNLPLAFTGQEYVWRAFYRSLGLTDADLAPFFSGPAFLPWQRMGNLQGWGGPLDDAWITSQRDLQIAILSAMRAYGMTPVLPGFAGHVPTALQRVYPNANFTSSAGWAGFNSTYSSVMLLEPTDPLFLTLGTTFHKMVLAEFGDPSGQEIPFFNADMYNEMDPNSGDLGYLQRCNAATYQAMANADPRSVYVMQAWLFHSGFWNPQRVQAYLSGVPVGGMLILDLNTEEGPVWNEYDSFYGHQWVWNGLLVYGGRRGIYGDADRLASGPYADRIASPSLVGIGITPEAIDMVLPMFDLMLEAGWRNTSVDSELWLQQFAVRRYGKVSPSVSSAYSLLHRAAFNESIDTSSIEKVPYVREAQEPGFSRNTNATGILQALRLMYTAGANGEVNARTGPFSYDLTDLSRQVLCNLFSDYHDLLGVQWTRGQANGVNNTVEVVALTDALLGIIDMLDQVNAADVNFLLGPWLADAARWAFNASQALNRDFNARNQITLWGPQGEINDYAAKVGWSGLVADYYGGRWRMFASYLVNATRTGVAPNWNQLYADILVFAQQWNSNISQKYPVEPSGADPVVLAGQVLSMYATGNKAAYNTLTNTAIATGSSPAKWTLLGTNVAAVGNDCPYEAHGPSDSLNSCEQACATDIACNVINWNPSIPDCVFRVCINALHPQLTPTQGYSVYASAANKTGAIYQAWHRDIDALMALCDADPGCVGFDSNGMFTVDSNLTTAQQGSTTYLKNTPPPNLELAYPEQLQVRLSVPEPRAADPWRLGSMVHKRDGGQRRL